MSASLLSPSPQVTAEELANHILSEIERTAGPQLPCYRAGEILTAFFGRFGGEDGMTIAQQAFKVHEGMWRSAPVTVLRFRESGDPYFALPLLEEARTAQE